MAFARCISATDGLGANVIPVESLLDAPIESVDAYQLLLNLKVALNRTTRPPLQIAVDATSLKEKVGLVTQLFSEREVIEFNSLLPTVHRTIDIVVSFMAILELAKLKFVEIIQTETYGPIQVRNVKPLNELNYALLDQF